QQRGEGRKAPQGDDQPAHYKPKRHEAGPEAETERLEPALPLEVGEQQHGRHDGAEAQEGQPERRVAQLDQDRAERDQHGRPPRPGGHSSTSRPSSAERYTASSTRSRARWSRRRGALTAPLMPARAT